MSNFQLYERYNEYSTNLIDIDPKVRQRAIGKMMQLFYEAPQLKLSIFSKIEQMKEDSDETVANYAKRVLQQLQSRKELPSEYVPRRPELPSAITQTPTTPTKPPQNVKSIVISIVCCIVFIIFFIFLTFYILR